MWNRSESSYSRPDTGYRRQSNIDLYDIITHSCIKSIRIADEDTTMEGIVLLMKPNSLVQSYRDYYVIIGDRNQRQILIF
jgi:hypothetical protein